MGAWSADTFGNDTACDWAADFLDDPGLHRVRETLERVVGEADYLDSDDGCMGLAACEVVARLQGRWGKRDAYSEALDAWIEGHPSAVPPELRVLSRAAIDRIRGANSELCELWFDGGGAWSAAVDDLRARVG